MSGHGKSLSSVTPDQQRIPLNNKRKKTSDTSITGKEIIQEPYNPSKRAKEDSTPDVEKSIKKTPPPFKNKEHYIFNTNEKTHGLYDCPSETDGCAINLGEEHKKRMKNSVYIPLR